MFCGKRPGSITDEMKQKIDTEQGRRIYGKRLWDRGTSKSLKVEIVRNIDGYIYEILTC